MLVAMKSHLEAKEGEDLETHVLMCGERYRTLFNRLTRIERVMMAVAGGIALIVVELLIVQFT
jgi:hypothetical protein